MPKIRFSKKEARVIEVIRTWGPSTALEVRIALGYGESMWRGFWVYSVLRQLVRAGILRDASEPGSPSRGGRPRWRYSLAPGGPNV